MSIKSLRDEISKLYLADENSLAAALITKAEMSPGETAETNALACGLVLRVRESRHDRNNIDAFTQEYALSSEEGVVLMCLAESLLRVPDAETMDKLIQDKIAGGNWERHLGQSESLFVNASTWALMLTGRMVDSDPLRWDHRATWRELVARMGEPVIRQAVATAVRILGRHFVLGRTIEEALREAKPYTKEGYLFSFDMLGEAACTHADAKKYMERYHRAVAAISEAAPTDDADVFRRPSISVKLTALHPRFEYVKRERVLKELLRPLTKLCSRAREANLGVTLDAEESNRLDLTLDLFEALSEEGQLRGWEGLGIAVQAYQKRACAVIAWLAGTAKQQNRRIPVRLVKGAYWDTEIKLAQVLGVSDYPVFTRKSGTDTSYLACARALFASRDAFFPQFATHNAHTLAAILAMAGANRNFEFQRLHGMGEELYGVYRQAVGGDTPATRIYAPVGSHEDLVAYLIRRLLENGTNTSFVNRLANEEATVDELIADPIKRLTKLTPKRNLRIPKPEELYSTNRRNSRGLLLCDPSVAQSLLNRMRRSLEDSLTAHPIVGGEERQRPCRHVLDPADRRRQVGEASEADDSDIDDAMAAASESQSRWDGLAGAARAEILERAAGLFEQERPLLMGLLVREAGRTVPNALSELREAVDFLRYYAAQARKQFQDSHLLPSVAGESNRLSLHGRGVFACISPWNFPLSIFTGQVAAALAAGNTVVAKPAEQTPLIAATAVRLLHEAGVESSVLHLLPGDGSRIGKRLFADQRLGGVAFTGSTNTAWEINRALAARDGPILTLIAETGGLNAMIVDSTALPEQVTRDVITSAFDSSGQRCSSLRLLFLQEDVAPRMEEMILGAMDELALGDPFDLATDVGPIIDEAALSKLEKQTKRLETKAKLLRVVKMGGSHGNGVFFPPRAFAVDEAKHIEEEIFGPVLAIVRFAGDRLEEVCRAINAGGYGLTLGIHSRINATTEFVRQRVRVGNIYVNRDQIGAVVEAQPFGGEGLSGTGPKAGGPHYLPSFAVERTLTVNTAAVGGNAALLAQDES